MSKNAKHTAIILLIIGSIGLLASFYNIFYNENTDAYMDLLGMLGSCTLIFGYFQIRSKSKNTRAKS